MSHTHEPWRVGETGTDDEGYPETIIFAMNDRAAVAVALDFGANNPLMREENARRIVACVNACAGLSTDELNRFGLGSAIGSQIHGLQVERDTYRELCGELKAELNLARACLSGLSTQDRDLNLFIDRASLAITKAEQLLGENNAT